MKKMAIIVLLLSHSLMTSLCAKGDFGVVNFKECAEKSKAGEEEKKNFEELKKQLSAALEESDKELSDLAKKLEDQDYLESLSPQAEEKLNTRFQQLSQEFARTQNQYYQLINQINYQILQKLHNIVTEACETIRKENALNVMLNQEACFAFDTTLNFTDKVIEEMNKLFVKQQASSAQEKENQEEQE